MTQVLVTCVSKDYQDSAYDSKEFPIPRIGEQFTLTKKIYFKKVFDVVDFYYVDKETTVKSVTYDLKMRTIYIECKE